MADYIPSTSVWVREQVEHYESSGGKEGTTLRDTGLPVVIVTHVGRKTGAIRKTPLMRVVTDDGKYVLVASKGGAPKNPAWYYSLREQPDVTIRDHEHVFQVRIHEVADPGERGRYVDAPLSQHKVRRRRSDRGNQEKRHAAVREGIG
jgi:deazaflavin-dependent oxidoreductase (nitroreductase family)